MAQSKKIAVVLAGCGNQDGSEITEAVSVIVALSQAGAQVSYFAPDVSFQAKNFVTRELTGEKRSVMLESARISRGNIQDIKQLNVQDFDGIVFPGGAGLAINLCNWGSKGAACEVVPEVQKVIEDFYAARKPIGAICIAPALIARVLGKHHVVVTLGNNPQSIEEVSKTGAIHKVIPVEDCWIDQEHKILTSPAYTYPEAKPHQVFAGIQKLVKSLVEMS